MAKIISVRQLKAKRSQICFTTAQINEIKMGVSLNRIETDDLYRTLEVAFRVDKNKYLHQKQLSEITGISVKKINQFIPNVRVRALENERMLANSFGAGYKIATEAEAANEYGKALQRVMAHASNLVSAIQEASSYDWTKIQGTKLGDLFHMSLRPASIYLSGFIGSFEKTVNEFKIERKLIDGQREEITRPLFEE